MTPDLKIISMRDIKTENINWIWQPYLPEGKLCLIQGDGGCGKTTLVLSISAFITTGTVLPYGKYNPPANVIFQTAEDGMADTIKPRLVKMGADCSRVHFIDEDEYPLSLSDERIEEAIIKTDAKLFIIDPIQGYLGGADMHTANGIRPLMKHLSGVADRTKCSVIIIGHLNKTGGKSQYRGLGSIDIYAAMRSVLTVGKIPDEENLRAVVHNKSNLAPAGASLAFELDPVHGFRWLGDYDISIEELLCGKKQQPESQFSKAVRLIKSMLINGEVAATDVEQMAKEQGISSKTLYRAKAELGVLSVKRGGQWFWDLPIEVEFTEVDQDGQDSQDGQNPHMTILTMLPEGKAV